MDLVQFQVDFICILSDTNFLDPQFRADRISKLDFGQNFALFSDRTRSESGPSFGHMPNPHHFGPISGGYMKMMAWSRDSGRLVLKIIRGHLLSHQHFDGLVLAAGPAAQALKTLHPLMQINVSIGKSVIFLCSVWRVYSIKKIFVPALC